MAKDPAFLFYPGDYLRDTQCLSEQAQVSYDRIMCEHMRNICITQAQLDFFTKRLTPDQKDELLMILTKIKGGFQIAWVAESIEKRRNYSDSRRKNREGKGKNISKSYVSHMENETVIVNEDEILNEYKEWTDLIFDKNDQHFETLLYNNRISIPDEVYQYWIMDHLDLLHRYPKMRPKTQQSFRQSALKHLRENHKKGLNGKQQTNKKQEYTDSLIAAHAKRWGKDAPTQ